MTRRMSALPNRWNLGNLTERLLSVFLSGPWMALAVYVDDVFEVDMGILLGRGQALVSQELLDNPQIRSSAQQM